MTQPKNKTTTRPTGPRTGAGHPLRRVGLFLALGLALAGGWRMLAGGGGSREGGIGPLPAGRPIIALGDSLTAGFGAAAGEDYPSQLAAIIGREVVNRGRNGATIADAARGLDDEVLALRPGLVIVLLGGNDLLRQRDLDESFAELQRLVERIQAGGGQVLLVGLDGLGPFGRVGGRYQKIARATGCLLVPDILDGIYGRPALMADQVHPNAKGYALMAARIAKALAPVLK